MSSALAISGVLLLFEGGAVLQAGREVPAPERIHYVAPEYPRIAGRTNPPVMGVVILEVTLGEDGHPTDIKNLYGLPLLDKAAIDAVIQWRYRPTLVNGETRRVVLREVVDLFPDAEAARQFFAGLVQDPKEQKVLRVIAADRLGKDKRHYRFATDALRKAASDADPDVSASAARALQKLQDTPE